MPSVSKVKTATAGLIKRIIRIMKVPTISKIMEDDCYEFKYVSGLLTIAGVSAIDGVEADGGKLVIRRLDGTLVPGGSVAGLPKGVYIVNGRKMVVK